MKKKDATIDTTTSALIPQTLPGYALMRVGPDAIRALLASNMGDRRITAGGSRHVSRRPVRLHARRRSE